MKLNRRTIMFAVILIAATTLIKFICAPIFGLSGFSSIIAIALFAGMIAKQKNTSFMLPLVALLVSDLIIEGLYQLNLFSFHGIYKYQLLNYALLLLVTLIGWAIKGKNIASIAIASFAAPTMFFLFSNFSVWFFSTTMYTKDFSGLMMCYEAGLPFYRNALISTFLFVPAIMFAYNYIVESKKQIAIS